MNNVITLIPLFTILFLCILNFYSMNSYLFTSGKIYIYYFATTLLCFIVNSLIIINWGKSTFYTLSLFTVGVPYFLSILSFAKDKISQVIFTVWLWISFYSLLQYVAEMIDHFTFKSFFFFTILRIAFLLAFFFVYNKYFKAVHRRFMETPDINWWLFSFIPMFFTILVWVTNYSFEKYRGSTDNYHINAIIYILMLLVYSVIVYTFNIVQNSTVNKMYAQEQISLLKKQYDFQLQREEMERIFRHDQRFRNSVLLNLLENGDIEGAKEHINKENSKMTATAAIPVCGNVLVNAIISEYRSKAEQSGLSFSVSVQMPDTIACGEFEFCVMLSNFLENSLDSAQSYISVKIMNFNSQLSINIENDYIGELKKTIDGWYESTKPKGLGLGLKSANSILKNNRGFLRIDDSDNIFKLFATMKN